MKNIIIDKNQGTRDGAILIYFNPLFNVLLTFVFGNLLILAGSKGLDYFFVIVFSLPTPIKHIT